MGAFWNNGTDDILVGVATINSGMAADRAYGTLDIYGRDPDYSEGLTYEMFNGSEVFYRVYLPGWESEYGAGQTLTFQDGDPFFQHDLAVELPTTPTVTPTPSVIEPSPTPFPGYFVTEYNPVPYTGNPAQLRMIDQWGYFLEGSDYEPAIGDEVGAFWDNGTDVILVGVTEINASMAENEFYFGLSIYGDDPDSHAELSDGLVDGEEIFYLVYSSNEGAVRGAEPVSVFSDGEINTQHDLFVGPPPLPSPTPYRPPWSYDYSGDGTSDIAIFRPSSGLWAVRGLTRVFFGRWGDIPVPGDYAGDGTAGFAVFRESSGMWAVRGGSRVYFGASEDTPVPGDYSGDGTADIGIFRGASGLWAVRGLTRLYFGRAGDLPVPGYYSGSPERDIAVFRPASGLWAVRGLTRIYFGSPEDLPVPGDYAGDGTWVPGIFRESTGLWAARGVTRVYFGSTGDQPLPADYGGGGRDEIGIFRSASGLWAARGLTRVYFGTAGDIPVVR